MGKLNDLMVRNAKPSEDGKPKKYVDGGLYLLVNKKGKYWRYNYKFLGKQKTVSFGVYPDVGLSDAREAFKEAKGLLSRGVDPSEYKQVRKYTAGLTANNTLEAVAREWFIIWKEDKSEVHSTKIAGRLEKDVYPYLGNRPIEQIEPPEILMLLRRIESRGAVETAHRVKQLLGQVFRYGVATGRAQRDQTADLKGALRSYRTKHFPAITDPKEVGQLLRVIDGYRGSQVVRCAFKLSPLVMLRPSELSGAEWAEIDFHNQTWTIPVKRMKAKQVIKDENASVHIVPLSRQAIEIFREIEPLTGRFQHVFTGERNRRVPMSPSTINTALKRLGYGDVMKAHSFRAMASSLLNEMGFNPDAIERQLSHKDDNKVRAAYNRAEYLEERRVMLQQWADYLDTLKNGADVIPINRKA